MMDLLAYADGKKDLIEIAVLIDVPINQLGENAQRLIDHGLIQMAVSRFKCNSR